MKEKKTKLKSKDASLIVKEIRSRLSGKLLSAIEEDISLHPEHAVLWAERLATRLFPQALEGSGENGEFQFQVMTYGAGDRLLAEVRERKKIKDADVEG